MVPTFSGVTDLSQFHSTFKVELKNCDRNADSTAVFTVYSKFMSKKFWSASREDGLWRCARASREGGLWRCARASREDGLWRVPPTLSRVDLCAKTVKDAVIRKHNLMYETSKLVFPHAVVEQYSCGSMVGEKSMSNSSSPLPFGAGPNNIHSLSSNTMALITLDCGAIRLPEQHDGSNHLGLCATAF